MNQPSMGFWIVGFVINVAAFIFAARWIWKETRRPRLPAPAAAEAASPETAISPSSSPPSV
ncbi:MAG: hypothetical protein HQL51_11245 [Magnetococcales bacterium]|nr:hypothetical protein [Magnetococcales bacterium]